MDAKHLHNFISFGIVKGLEVFRLARSGALLVARESDSIYAKTVFVAKVVEEIFACPRRLGLGEKTLNGQLRVHLSFHFR